MKTLLRVQDKIFDRTKEESLQFPNVENGGRLIGYIYTEGNNRVVDIRTTIKAGPNARRTATSFFQDGEYQFHQLKKIRAMDPGICYLGSWHNHLCNGYPKLSSGDIETYRKIVNRPDYPEQYFAAILLVPDNMGGIVHKVYLFEKGKDEFIEFQQGEYEVYTLTRNKSFANLQNMRTVDNCIIKGLFPKLNPFLRNSSIVWKGTLKIKKSYCKIELIQSLKTGEWEIRASRYKRVLKKVNKSSHLYAHKLLFTFYTEALQYRRLTGWIVR